MSHRQRPACLVCQRQASKYTCTSCKADYCSVACYKQHQETCSTGTNTVAVSTDAGEPPAQAPPDADATPPEPLQDPTPLRPLTALKWPYVPDTSAYPNPLTRDDPKPLQTHHYEAIATSPAIRTVLASNPRLLTLLTSIDALRGSEREEALQRALSVDSRLLKNDDAGISLDEDTQAFRELAEAVECAVRGGREDVLGLNWDQV